MNTEMSSQNGKHLKALRDRVERSSMLPSSLPELDLRSPQGLRVYSGNCQAHVCRSSTTGRDPIPSSAGLAAREKIMLSQIKDVC